MINNGMSWLSLGNYINPKARNTELSNDYNQLTNRPIITLTGTSQNPIKLWKLDVGLYILNGYVQHTDALLSEARGLFVSATVGIVNGKYVISAFIPFWEGQYEYILPSLSSETYTEHQMIRMITQGNSLTLDNIREYFPTQDYHPTTKKYVDETMDAIRNELGKMGLNNNDVQSLIKENRRRDIAIQALLSQNSDKMVTIDEEVHNISMDYSLDKGIATINTLEGDTLVNVSKDTEYDKVLSYEQDIVENTNTVDLEVDGNLNPIIVGDTLVNVCTQNNPTAITNEYTVEGSNHFALQDEVEGNCRPIIQGNTIVNRSKTKDITPLTTYVSEVEGNEMSLVNDTDTHVRVDKLVGNTLVNCLGENPTLSNGFTINDKGNFYLNKTETQTSASMFRYYNHKCEVSKTYTLIFDIIKNTLTREDGSTSTTIGKFNIVSYNGGCLFIEAGFVGRICVALKQPDASTGAPYLEIMGGAVGEIEITKPMIFEGDLTQTPELIPTEYVKGLKNSYEDECIEVKDLSFTITGDSNPDKRIIYFDDTYIFKPNTTYTVMLDLTIVEESDYMTIRVHTNRGDSSGGSSTSIVKDKIKENHIIRTITTTDRVSTLAIYHVTGDPTYGTSFGKVMINKLCILEGDYTSNPPTYEEVMEHSGQYRCKVEVQGENYNQTQTVYLNSPLLKGDKVVYKEGELCHYHKMGKVVLDGSNDENWYASDSYDTTQPRYWIIHSFGAGEKAKIGSDVTSQQISDKMLIANPYSTEYTKDCCCILANSVRIRKNEFVGNLNNFKQWLQQNPTTIVYELANPYYETISTSELLLPITTNCKLLTSSNIPLTTMSTKVFTEEVNILANTQYSLNFNSDIASTVNITLGGTVLSNQAIVKGYNKLSITTPSTLVDNLLIIEGSGVDISEVVVTEYDEGVCEYIEGLKSSFEDGYIPPKNLLNDYEVIKSSNSTHQYSRVAVKPNTIYTLFYPSLITEGCNNVYGVYNTEGTSALLTFSVSESPRTFNTGNREAVNVYGRLKRSNGNLVIYTDPESLDDNWNKGLALFEGDWTHLHLTEEDLNHLGQYKVEYKTVGKNKFNPQNFDDKLVSYSYENNQLVLEAHNPTIWGQTFTKIQLKPNTYYILSTKPIIDTEKGGYALVVARKADDNALNPVATESASSTIFKTDETGLTRIKFYCTAGSTSGISTGKVTYANIQLEEGTVATEYEPYKESTQTVYLNSPLLEGDTIEEIDGEVYHVHRCGEVVLDGSEDWKPNRDKDVNTISFYVRLGNGVQLKRDPSIAIENFNSILQSEWEKLTDKDFEWAFYNSEGTCIMFINIYRNKLLTEDANGLKQWLSENPTKVVYELENPTYELIPSSSIVCKSYPNGHLDFDTNVHINNTVNFVKANLPITYANTSTNYKLQFVSNKDMENVTINVLGNIMENVTITKGLNKISFTSPSDATNILTFEGLGYAYISDVQLVATEKDIDYFKGLYSTYECGLIEDESNENYGKYEVNIVSYNAPIQFGKGGKIE